MPDPVVSVIITAFNRETYISEAIESVLGSTYGNYELIVVDDGSTDRSFEIAQSYSPDSRVRVYRNQKNLGQFRNRDYAATLAAGSLIKYLDSDDLLYPWGLEIMVSAMIEHPAAAFAIPGIPNENRPFPIVCRGMEGFKKHFLRETEFIHGPSATILRKDAFMEHGGFGPGYYVGSDTDLLIKLALYHDYLKIQPALIWWREHPEQEYRQGNERYEYFQIQYGKTYRWIVHEDSPLNPEEQRRALRKLRNLYIGKIWRLLCRFRIVPVYRFLKTRMKPANQLLSS